MASSPAAAADPSTSTHAAVSTGPAHKTAATAMATATAPSAPVVTPIVAAVTTPTSTHPNTRPASCNPPRSQDFPFRRIWQYSREIDQLANASDPYSLQSHQSHDGVKDLMKQQNDHLTFVRHLCTMVRLKQLREVDLIFAHVTSALSNNSF
jgi:hypothetical protein